MNRHLKRCAVCGKMARQLYKLEEGWRNQPIPAECAITKAAFLEKLPALEKLPKSDEFEKPDNRAQRRKRAKAARLKPVLRPWRPKRWAALAAMLLIGVSAFAWLLLSPGQSRAGSSDIVDRLVEWNLELANADPKDRKRSFELNEANLRDELDKNKDALSAEDFKIAEDLLETGCWLALNEDPVAEAARITDLADKLAERAEVADKTGSKKEKERFGLCYSRFMQFGVSPMKKGASPMFLKFSQPKGPPDGKKKIDFEIHRKELERIWERLPERSRPDLHKKFDGLNKKAFGGFKGGRK